MNREIFLTRLSELLASVPDAEREEMLQYYRDYFEDAGAENEAEVLRTLGSPETVAEGLLADFEESPATSAMPGDRAVVEYGKIFQEEPERIVPQRTASAVQPGYGGTSGQPGKRGSSGWKLVFIILLCVCGLPILIPMLAALILLVLLGLAAWLLLCFAGICITIALFSAMIALIVTGVCCMFLQPAVGLSVVGAGLLCGGLGFLSLIVTTLMTGAATPSIFSAIGRMFHRRRKD